MEWQHSKYYRVTLEKLLIPNMRILPLQHACREMAATRFARKSLRVTNTRKRPWIRFAAESKTSARRESNIPIWPALRKTLVFPNCKKQTEAVKYVKRHGRTSKKNYKWQCVTTEISLQIISLTIDITNKPDNSQALISAVFSRSWFYHHNWKHIKMANEIKYIELEKWTLNFRCHKHKQDQIWRWCSQKLLETYYELFFGS